MREQLTRGRFFKGVQRYMDSKNEGKKKNFWRLKLYYE